MRTRMLALLAAVVTAFALLAVTVALAQGPVVAPDETEARREAEAAAALEANPGPELRAAPFFTPPATITGPLFVGLSDIAAFSYLVDPADGQSYPLFDGFELWGAAYDAANQRVFFNRGPTLYAWPLDGAPASMGLIVGGESGANLSMVGLAFHDGVLYASRTLSSAADPEGIYTIDTATLSATLALSYTAGANTADIGGLAVDPASGALYGTNDQAAGRGLVRLEPNGDLTLVAPYPAGQNDLDGLAIGDGRAYLVADEPGNIFVFDFATLTYTAPITAPWTTADLFSAATWITPAAPVTPTIGLTKTVGLEPGACAAGNSLSVAAGTEVTYCYQVTNTGPVTLTRHSLSDSALGALLDDVAVELAPGASHSVTQAATITATIVNTATWTAFNPGPTDVATATATATVTVTVVEQPAISLVKTVSDDMGDCGASTSLTVERGQPVLTCFTVTNTGDVALDLHDLVDSHFGSLLTAEALDLLPGASTTITRAATLSATMTNTATWTAYNPGPTDVVSATASATVTVVEPEIAVVPASLAVELDPGATTTATLTISNTGTAPLDWTLALAPAMCDAPGAVPWATAAPDAGVVAPGSTATVTVTINAVGLASGLHKAVLCISSDDVDESTVSVPLSLTVAAYKAYLPIIAGGAGDE